MKRMNLILEDSAFHFPIRMNERKSEAEAERARHSVRNVRLVFEAPFKFESENGGGASHVQRSPVVTCELARHKLTEYIKTLARKVNN